MERDAARGRTGGRACMERQREKGRRGGGEDRRGIHEGSSPCMAASSTDRLPPAGCTIAIVSTFFAPTSCLPIHAAYPAPSGWRHAQDASGVKLPRASLLRPFPSSSRSLFPILLPPRCVPPTLLSLYDPVRSILLLGGITIPSDF